jgi:hypothetical protein
MKLFEMLIDEDNLFSGVNAVSIVENPAIQSDFVALAENEQPIQLAEVSKDKRILMGAALIPDKPIYRNMDGEEFYIYFSKDTVRQAAELFFKRSNHQNATLEHSQALSGMTVFESWIIEDTQMDKSKSYGLELPEGTWMVSMKVDDEDIWNNYVKNNKVFGFSIEGQFANKLVKDVEMSNQEIELSDDELKELEDRAQFEVLLEALAGATDVELETYNDYPQAAKNNAKRAIEYKKKNGSSCGTSVGWTRAGQLARGEKLSRSTIARMASFKRHQQNKDVPYSEGCGGIMWDAWGGSAGVNWAISKLKKIDKK